jgi:hypothetical protein
MMNLKNTPTQENSGMENRQNLEGGVADILITDIRK